MKHLVAALSFIVLGVHAMELKEQSHTFATPTNLTWKCIQCPGYYFKNKLRVIEHATVTYHKVRITNEELPSEYDICTACYVRLEFFADKSLHLKYNPQHRTWHFIDETQKGKTYNCDTCKITFKNRKEHCKHMKLFADHDLSILE